MSTPNLDAAAYRQFLIAELAAQYRRAITRHEAEPEGSQAQRDAAKELGRVIEVCQRLDIIGEVFKASKAS